MDKWWNRWPAATLMTSVPSIVISLRGAHAPMSKISTLVWLCRKCCRTSHYANETAVESATKAFPAWRALSYQQRSQYLQRIADQIEVLNFYLRYFFYIEGNLICRTASTFLCRSSARIPGSLLSTAASRPWYRQLKYFLGWRKKLTSPEQSTTFDSSRVQ